MLDNQIVKISNPFEPLKREYIPVPFMEGRSVGELIKLSDMQCSVVVLKNGEVANLKDILLPGDVIHIYPKLQDDTLKTLGLIGVAIVASYYVGPAVAGYVGTTLGAGSVVGGIAGGIATVATVTAGGLILNAGLSASTPSPRSYEESPTYSFDLSENPAREGLAIPVIYGDVITYPNIINQWLDVTDGEQWAHTVYCIAEGETNNEPIANDIYIDDQLLSALDTDDYTLVTTAGNDSPDWNSNTDFTYPHQMRAIDQQLKQAIISSFLLHFNGAGGSTTIFDDSAETNNWTCRNGAKLSTNDEFLGTACLNVQGSNDYILCDNEDSFDIWTSSNWAFECRWRQNSLEDSAIIGQQRTVSGGDSYYWGIFYDQANDKLRFQQYKVTNGGVYTVYCNISITPTGFQTDTWHHICVQKKGENHIYLAIDGEGTDAGGYDISPVDPPAGIWIQAIGKAQRYTTTPSEANTAWYAQAKIDEARLVNNGILYDFDSFNPPSSELTDNGSDEYIFYTKGYVDNFAIIITAPFGIYELQADGTIDNVPVSFSVYYRIFGSSSSWTLANETINAASRNPYRARFEYTGLTREKYEIKIRRTTKDYEETTFQATTNLSYIDEWLSVELYYPYLQCIGLSLKAQDQFSGRIPRVRVVSNRSLITIPGEQGVDTRTINPTNNAYAAIDMLTSSIYSNGINADRIIDDDFDTWIDWCDGTVDGYKRCQLNIIFDSVSTLDEALQNVENCGRAKIIRRGTKISVNVDKPKTSSALFGLGNIVPGSEHVRWLRQSERSDAVEIRYRDINSDYSENTIFKPSENYNSLTRPPRVVSLFIPGINNKEQAEREALLRQQISDSIKKSVEFQSGLEAIPVVSGDVFNYQASINSFSGRLPLSNNRAESWTSSTIYLDQEINLDSTVFSGNCIIMIRDPDDTLQSYTVTGPFDTDTWTVTISTTTTFNYLSPYTICRSTGDVYQYKISKMSRTNKLDFRIEGLQYSSTAYYNINYAGGSTAI